MLNFTYKEKIAIIILFGIIVIIVICIKIFSYNSNLTWKKDIVFNEEKVHFKTQKSLFYFDPNTLSEDSFEMLDISPKAIRSIINYRNKGGKFYNKEKVKSMWNLSFQEYQKIESYIQISMFATNRISPKQYTTIEINRADSLSWSKLPIPKFLISKIMIYKNRLGGFYDIQQLKEISYFTNDIFDRIKSYIQCDSTYIVKQNINTVTQENLVLHPYIDYPTASRIVDYRYKKVRIKNWEELKKLDLDSAYIQTLKIYFYLP